MFIRGYWLRLRPPLPQLAAAPQLRYALGFVAGEPGLPLVIPSFADFGSGPGFLLDRPECEIEGSWIDGTEVHLMTSEPLVSGPQRLAL